MRFPAISASNSFRGFGNPTAPKRLKACFPLGEVVHTSRKCRNGSSRSEFIRQSILTHHVAKFWFSLHVAPTNSPREKPPKGRSNAANRGGQDCRLCGLLNRELKQATFLSIRTAAGSKLRRYRWRMMASAVLV